MKILLLTIGALLVLGDFAHASELRDPIPPGPYHNTYTTSAANSREPLKRLLIDLTHSSTARITQAWTYLEWEGGQTTCGHVQVNGRDQRFIFQLSGKEFAGSDYYQTTQASDWDFERAGCDRPRAAKIIPPQF